MKQKSTSVVQRFRERQKLDGAKVLYSMVDVFTADALDDICLHHLCSKRTAIEMAIRQYRKGIKS